LVFPTWIAQFPDLRANSLVKLRLQHYILHVRVGKKSKLVFIEEIKFWCSSACLLWWCARLISSLKVAARFKVLGTSFIRVLASAGVWKRINLTNP
jgi:NADH dehydrogenase FAD-containing subunit